MNYQLYASKADDKDGSVVALSRVLISIRCYMVLQSKTSSSSPATIAITPNSTFLTPQGVQVARLSAAQ
ncbi:hypothetical protein PM082_021959 [Marasmius tenuissimus]|nr:hypothetical protein PM082_021959 [Marasmius tenuissimus]